MAVPWRSTLAEEDTIKALVTESANDARVVICKAHDPKANTLGMTDTTYVNASGLPDEQITARDQALLGRAI